MQHQILPISIPLKEIRWPAGPGRASLCLGQWPSGHGISRRKYCGAGEHLFP